MAVLDAAWLSDTFLGAESAWVVVCSCLELIGRGGNRLAVALKGWANVSWYRVGVWDFCEVHLSNLTQYHCA